MNINSKKELSIYLGKLNPLDEPKVLLEQYSTPPDIASDILFLARNDIVNKKVADFGCGNGIFGIGAKLLGALEVFCVEIDPEAIRKASENAEALGVDIRFINTDVRNFDAYVDTVLENPPFGYQLRGADLPFIEKSLERSKIFYMLQSSMARNHILNEIHGRGELLWEKNYKFNLPYTFKFHKNQIREMDVTLFVVKVMKQYGKGSGTR